LWVGFNSFIDNRANIGGHGWIFHVYSEEVLLLVERTTFEPV